MGKSGYQPEQIISKLRKAEVLLTGAGHFFILGYIKMMQERQRVYLSLYKPQRHYEALMQTYEEILSLRRQQ